MGNTGSAFLPDKGPKLSCSCCLQTRLWSLFKVLAQTLVSLELQLVVTAAVPLPSIL